MYKSEVPLYGDLVRIVSKANAQAAQQISDPQILRMRMGNATKSRLEVERHGAIRLGTPQELETICLVFRILGLYPIGYYDLSEAGLPMHATCFRPITQTALQKNPFRVFTSLLRPELIASDNARTLAAELLSTRHIFSNELLHLLGCAAQQHGRLTLEQSSKFVEEAVRIFRWQGVSIAAPEQYQCLKAEHPIVADIACFGTPHINHLTPRTLDITVTQQMLHDEGLRAKKHIEGPPHRACPILLRQTSFLAVEEPFRFAQGVESKETEAQDQTLSDLRGAHRARFGEVEERGAAVTPAGQALYDDLYRTATARSKDKTVVERESLQMELFRDYPDDWTELRRRRLVYFTYQCTSQDGIKFSPSADKNGEADTATIEELLQEGVIEAVPITYEDFLPLSAAGIFQSNIGERASPHGRKESQPGTEAGSGSLQMMEEAMNARILDLNTWYRVLEEDSIHACSKSLGIRIIV
jgi:uncharacterized glyoxalase superfamily metalloenzyme YdcJ